MRGWWTGLQKQESSAWWQQRDDPVKVAARAAHSQATEALFGSQTLSSRRTATPKYPKLRVHTYQIPLYLLFLWQDLMYPRIALLALNSLCNWGWLDPSAFISFDCWDCRHIPPHLIYVVLKIEPRALCLLGKQSTNWAIFPVPTLDFEFIHL